MNEVQTDSIRYLTDKGHSSNFHQVQQFVGLRPGNKTLDPYYLRKGMANKPYFWDHESKKWRLVREGDKFYFDENNIPRMEKI